MQDLTLSPRTDPSGPGELAAGELASDAPGEAAPVGDLTPLLFAGFGFAVLVFTLVRMYRRRVQTQTDQFATPPAQRLADIREQAHRARDPIDQLMADATELTTQLATQLDAKAAYLERLLDRAEMVAERLERAREAGPAAASTPHAPPSQISPSLRDGSGGDPMQRQIYALADQGLDSLAIAQRLGQPKGQVELVLKLRRA